MRRRYRDAYYPDHSSGPSVSIGHAGGPCDPVFPEDFVHRLDRARAGRTVDTDMPSALKAGAG